MNMNVTFSKLHINPGDNFLVKPYSEEHGEGFIITDDPVQEAAGLLIENLDGEDGMIVLAKGDEIAFVIKTGEEEVSFIDYEKGAFSLTGRIYKENNLHYAGLLIDRGEDDTGKHKLQIISKEVVYIEND